MVEIKLCSLINNNPADRGVVFDTCSKSWILSHLTAPTFSGGQVLGHLDNNMMNEISGVCASRAHSDTLYVQNDSGDTHRIFAIGWVTLNCLGKTQIHVLFYHL